MAGEIGFNFRSTSAYIADGTGFAYITAADTYPTTRAITGGPVDGVSNVTAGWSATPGAANRTTSYGPKLAGINHNSNAGATKTFTIDLPKGAGNYDIRLAAGDNSSAQGVKLVFKDGTGGTTLFTINSTGTVAAGSSLDAMGTVHTFPNWAANNVARSVTFTQTKLEIVVGGHTDTASASIISSLSLNFTGGGDTTAPTLSSSTTASVTSSTATVGCTTDEANGTMYAIVCTSATPPSVAQIQAGHDSSGGAAAYAGNQAITTTGAKTFSATGLAASTTYYHYEQHKDAAGNDSTVIASASFATSAGAATGVTMSGPSSGTVSVASSNFNIGVTPGGGTITGTVTVTPSDGGAGGTFTPTTVNLTSGSPTATFTYTAASTGAKTISVTNNGSLTNPSNITYTANAAANSLFRNNPGGALSGLGTGGPFFQNPLQ